MKKSAFLGKIENYGLIIISTGVALIYWRIESLKLGTTSTLCGSLFFFFIGYGVFTQYFINSHKRIWAEIISLSHYRSPHRSVQQKRIHDPCGSAD